MGSHVLDRNQSTPTYVELCRFAKTANDNTCPALARWDQQSIAYKEIKQMICHRKCLIKVSRAVSKKNH
jgi:hypothetical protein